MMESETPPASPPHGAGDPEVSSWRSPDPPRPEANTSAAPSPVCPAAMKGSKKGPGESGVRSDTLTGLLEQAALSEDHRTLMGTVFEKISSATSVLNEAFTSLLKGFEVRNKTRTFSVVPHTLGVLCIDSSPRDSGCQPLGGKWRITLTVMIALYLCAGG